MIQLSCCLIVKDEEANLDRCLGSIAGHVDEVVVVDTGSTDRTIEVATRYGARVHPFDPHTAPAHFFVDDAAGTCSAPPPYTGETMLGDFGAARRKSFDLARGEYVMWIDADDALEGGQNLRAIVAKMRAEGVDMAFLPYDYARDEQGRVFYRQWRERIIRAGCASWINPVHEVLMPTRPVKQGRFEGVTFAHHRKADRKTIPNRNYKILLRQLDADKRNGSAVDPRTLFYLGQEARYIEPLRAAEWYEEYLRRSGWGEERAAAHVALGTMLEFGALGSSPEDAYSRANREYATAAADMPSNPDGLFGMARIAYHRQRWHDCIDFTERGFAVGNTDSMLGANPLDRTYRPHLYYNAALYRMGRIEDAIKSCEAGLAVLPEDPGVPGGGPGMLKANLAMFKAELAARVTAQAPAPPAGAREMAVIDKNEDVDAPPVKIPPDALCIYAMQLWKNIAHFERNGQKARAFLAALPLAIVNDESVSRMRASTERRWPTSGAGATMLPIDPQQFFRGTLPSIVTGKLRIVFWVGPAVEPWDPTTPNKTGIGGSETACIEMARELVARGHEVTVYGCLPGGDGGTPGIVFDKVVYRHWQVAQPPIECDVFIASRAPAIMDDPSKIRAAVKLLWVHDIHVGPPSPQMERWLLAFDRVLCLSQWHRDFFVGTYPGIDPGKVLVTRNGIDPARFDCLNEHCFDDGCCKLHPPKRNHLVSASSPNRGLDTLVLNFPHIRARVPDAELHVYYGFDCWESFARARGDQAEIQQIEAFKTFLRDRAHPGSGIFIHGRVDQKRLAEAYLRAKVRPHWTAFTETSFIGGMEAQAAGCVPVHSGVAALAETIKYGIMVPLDQPQKFVDECVRLLTDEDYRRPLADAGRKWALENLSWKGLAAEWEETFKRVAEELRADPLSKYVEVGR